MLLRDEAINEVVDQYMVERFITAASVSAKKTRIYAEKAEQPEVRRLFKMSAEANDATIKLLKATIPRLG